MKISFVMITARTDYPYLGRPNLHVFEPTLESFKQQTMTDFEWIIVDALYEQRKDYFKKLNLPFSIKHVPAHPNLWHEKGLPGISTQYNKGIIYADSDLLFFTGDSYMVVPTFMQRLLTSYEQGYFPLAWYLYDNSYVSPPPAEDSEAPIRYNILGYTGEKVFVEHRYFEAFKNNNLQLRHTPWLWWFGCSSASLEAMLKINGFNQAFDGDRMLLDCDVGSRLEIAGYGNRLAIFRDIFLIRATTDTSWNPSLKKGKISIKCNYPLIWHSRFFKQYKANTQKLGDKDIQWIKEVFCKRYCPIRQQCKREHPWQYPFEHKDIPSHPPSSKSSKEWFNFWKRHQTIIDLSEEREKRLSGHKKYAEATCV